MIKLVLRKIPHFIEVLPSTVRNTIIAMRMETLYIHLTVRQSIMFHRAFHLSQHLLNTTRRRHI